MNVEHNHNPLKHKSLWWSLHATLFCTGLIVTCVWLITFIAIVIGNIFSGETISEYAYIAFMIIGGYGLPALLYEIPNYRSGYLYSMGRIE